jgi:hypothetical protein
MVDRCYMRETMDLRSACSDANEGTSKFKPSERVNVLINECTLYLPLNMLRNGIRLVDTAGLGDGDPVMKEATAQSIRTATMCIAMVTRGLNVSGSGVKEVLLKNGFIHKMIR